jgi:hypothetical protein
VETLYLSTAEVAYVISAFRRSIPPLIVNNDSATDVSNLQFYRRRCSLNDSVA